MFPLCESVIGTRVFALNKSKSKFVLIGIGKDVNEKWSTQIIISGTFWRGIKLSVEEWQKLSENFREIKSYLSGSTGGRSISLSSECKVSLKETYEKRSITFNKHDGK